MFGQNQFHVKMMVSVMSDKPEQAEKQLDEMVRDFSFQSDYNLLRMVEALLFASAIPLTESDILHRLPEGKDWDVAQCLAKLQSIYAGRGINLLKVASGWAFRTAEDLAFLMSQQAVEQKKLSRAALETLAIIAYHQPVTRAEIEDVRGVSTSRGTLDVLLKISWICLRGRRRSPGRPVTYGTTPEFLNHFGLDMISDLPGLEELKGAGLLDPNLPPHFDMPLPLDASVLHHDEDPLNEDDCNLDDTIDGGRHE